jgi:hypothetical protein
MWIIALWEMCAVAGAVAAAFALCRQRATPALRVLPSWLAAVAIGIAFTAAAALARHHFAGVAI